MIFECFYEFCSSRNRLHELADYRVPLGDDGSIGSSNLTDDEVNYMMNATRETPWTNEVPTNMPKKICLKRMCAKQRVTELKFEGFSLEDKFPQNVCIMKGLKPIIVVCDEFRENDGKFVVRGRRFLIVRDAYVDKRGISSEVDYHTVSELSNTSEMWFATDVKTKCICLPYNVAGCDADRIRRRDATPNTWNTWFISGMVL